MSTHHYPDRWVTIVTGEVIYVAGPFVDPAVGLRLAIGTTLRRRSLRRG